MLVQLVYESARLYWAPLVVLEVWHGGEIIYDKTAAILVTLARRLSTEGGRIFRGVAVWA